MPARPFQSRGGTTRPYHLRDDFGDGRTTDRQGATTHQHPEPYDFTGAGRMLAAQYRPEWVTLDAGPSVTDGRLSHDYTESGTGHIATASELRTGRWHFGYEWLERDQDGPADVTIVDLLASHPREAPRWSVRLDSKGSVSLRRADGAGNVTEVISASLRRPDTPFGVTVTRSPQNRWRLSINGITRGTLTDPFLPEPGTLTLRFEPHGASVAAISDLEVR